MKRSSTTGLYSEAGRNCVVGGGQNGQGRFISSMKKPYVVIVSESLLSAHQSSGAMFAPCRAA